MAGRLMKQILFGNDKQKERGKDKQKGYWGMDEGTRPPIVDS